MMRKRIIGFVLAFLMVIAVLPMDGITVLAATAEYRITGGSIYFDLRTGMVTGYNGSVTDVDIPAEINGVKVIGIGDGAFDSCYSLKSVTIPEGVTTIGSAAFYDCDNLTSINFPQSITEIGSAAFYFCRGLTSITIPEGVTTISAWSFGHCHGLESITIPEGVTTIEDSAFFSCESLTSVTIPVGVTSIGNAAFSWCRFMTDVTIPEGVRTIGDHAFSYCYSLRNAAIPEGVTAIGSSAFSYGYDLMHVTIPASVTTIGDTAFEYCGSSLEITYIGSQKQWMDIDKGNNDFTNITIHYQNSCDHDYEAVRTEPTCTDSGYTTYSCRLCEDAYVDDYVTALGHDTTDYGAKAPTCTEVGWEAYETCSRCDYTTYEELSALEHEYENGICTRCGAADPNAEKPGHDCPSKGFTDVPVYGSWAHDGIDYCVESKLMNGTGGGLFNPDGTVSRAQLVTILYRAAGSPETKCTGTFTDVPAGQWYSAAIEWAAENGVVQGIGNGKFGPDQSITREQIATILYRYEKEPAVTGNLDKFPDQGKVSTFSKNALIWATQEELINGVNMNGVTSLAPKNNATRAQISAIIMRYLEK